jgi:phosphatidylserine decarboxylase
VSTIPRRWRLLLGLLKRLPQGVLSRATGALADVPVPRGLRGLVIGGFARVVGVDTGEVAGSPRDFPSVGAFFVRRLRVGVRSWPDDPRMLASPVDGVVGALGEIREGTVLQAKGMPYGVGELLAHPASPDLDARRFEGGRFLTLYLSPRHYHRIHAPASGDLIRAQAIPGRLLPVNEPAIRGIARLFPRNERLVLWMEAEGAPLALVAVGAFNVGRISVAFDDGWNGPGGEGVTNRPGRRGGGVRDYAPPLPLARGEEVAAFHLGSTVVLLVGPDAEGQVPGLAPHLRPGDEIRLGDPLTVRSTGPGPAPGPDRR